MDRPGSGLRKLIGFLLVLNLVVLLAGLALQRWSSQPGRPLAFNADKIELLESTRPPDERAAAPGANEGATADVAAPVAEAATEETGRCLAWRDLDAEGLLAIEEHLERQGMAVGLYEFRLARRLGWWVYLPPFQDARALQAALDDVRGKGVTDLAVVRSGGMVNAISLGAFPTLEKARAHAGTLTGKGIAGVRVGPRPGVGDTRLVFTGDVAAERLAALSAAWPGVLKPVRCQVED